MASIARTFVDAVGHELTYLRRDRLALAMITIMPLAVIVIVAAMLFSGVPRHLPVAIVDQDHSAFSRDIATAAVGVAAITVAANPATLDEAQHLVRSGKVWAILLIPKGAGDGLTRWSRPAVFIFYNASYLSIGSTAGSGLEAAVKAVAAEHGAIALRQRGAPDLRLQVPKVQASILLNPEISYEWYLQSLINPGVLHLLACCVAAAVVGRLAFNGSLGCVRSLSQSAAVLAGSLAPHIAMLSLWSLVWLLWLVGARGWQPLGSLALIVLAHILLLTASASISTLLIAVTREINTAVSVSAVYAGSALAYSGATLSLNGANGFARAWSSGLPFTAYLRIQMDQFVGALPVTALSPLVLLAGYTLVPAALALVLFRRRAGAPVAV
ncbi:ABC transporter permease [Polymorphobacter arshaanensis]|uniref:ABC transporter permease n=1 Tax=Glacieibacterium arshaanense TaxID=2511025 RepID=A0A4Y9EQG8_9SPHN|nr:ABC transporter permease [Polymorphobacter arshaanensis]TFU05861.1 ABC transporter permease [Polymorphobacter arshaanensis]